MKHKIFLLLIACSIFMSACNSSAKDDHYTKGEDAFFANDSETAKEEFELAIQEDSKNIKAYNSLGGVYLMEGNIEKAIEAYGQVIEIDPNFSFAYQQRGQLYSITGKELEALADFKKAIDLSPQYAFLYFVRGVTYENSNLLKAACDDYEKASELDMKEARDRADALCKK